MCDGRFICHTDVSRICSRKQVPKRHSEVSDIVIGHSHGLSLVRFISKDMRENRKGEVMGHSPQETQSLDIVIRHSHSHCDEESFEVIQCYE